ncbi:hypothetical protein NDU88_001737 [Pleurodeles waltl]|uniref:Uncharacterized protein n=1 Tax=Pleurodeles waltl TaxID=8319 RepID=A0AAV7VX98_PLEWA|nr:hypothetical protein NDU88_001737 [Pleurodeles waltl]
MVSAPSSCEPLIIAHRCTANSNSIQTVPRNRQQSHVCLHRQPQTSAAVTLPPHASSNPEARPFSGFAQIIDGSGQNLLGSDSGVRFRYTECVRSFQTRTTGSQLALIQKSQNRRYFQDGGRV